MAYCRNFDGLPTRRPLIIFLISDAASPQARNKKIDR